MKYLLDTNICIAYLAGRSIPVKQRIIESKPEELALCSIVKSELLFGAYNSEKVTKNLEKLRVFFSEIHSFPFDDEAADAAGIIRVDLSRQGKPIGPNDLLIASIALANDLTLVTHNTSEFSRVDGLCVEDWQFPP